MDDHLEWAVAAYRFTPNEVLLMSPYQAMMGQAPTLPFSWRLADADVSPRKFDPILDRESFVQDMNEVADLARKSIEASQAKAKIAFIGMASWSRRFIKDLGRIAKPLHEIVKASAFRDGKSR